MISYVKDNYYYELLEDLRIAETNLREYDSYSNRLEYAAKINKVNDYITERKKESCHEATNKNTYSVSIIQQIKIKIKSWRESWNKPFKNYCHVITKNRFKSKN